MNRRKLSLADIVILAGGAIMLLASFLAFYESKVGGTSVAEANAWDRGLFMVATLPALIGIVMALQIGLQAFGNITMPNRVLGMTWDQFHLVLSLQATLLLLAFLLRARPNELVFDTRVQVVFGAGFWLMLAGAAALVLGALMRLAAARRRPRAV